MTKRKHHGVTIECVQGNIANQPDMEAIVNAANAELRTGGGVAGAIHRAAGPGLEAECRPLAPIRPGQAVITGAHNLPNRPEFHQAANATHMSFLAPCTADEAKALPPMICADPPAFDRTAFHRTFNAQALQFFRRKLRK